MENMESRTDQPPELCLLKLAEAAEVLRASPRTLHRWIRAGRLKALKPAGQWLISEANIREFLASSPRKDKAPRKRSRPKSEKTKVARLDQAAKKPEKMHRAQLELIPTSTDKGADRKGE